MRKKVSQQTLDSYLQQHGLVEIEAISKDELLGEWYVYRDSFIPTDSIVYSKSENLTNIGYWRGKWSTRLLCGRHPSVWRKATSKEIHTALIKRAKEVGCYVSQKGVEYENTMGVRQVSRHELRLWGQTGLVCGNMQGLIYDARKDLWGRILK